MTAILTVPCAKSAVLALNNSAATTSRSLFITSSWSFHCNGRAGSRLGALQGSSPDLRVYSGGRRIFCFHADVCSRHRPRAFWAGRSEKLNSTASVSAVWDTGHHDGTTNTSLGFHSNVLSPTDVRPVPSTAQYTVPSVVRYGAPWNPAG